MRLLSLIVLFLSGISLACKAGPGKTAKKETRGDNSILWRISREGMPVSHLFGTIHMICAEDYIWTPSMKSALEESELLCMELDMDDPALMMEIAAGMIDTTGKSLRDYFSEEDYLRLERYVRDSLGGDIARFSSFRPLVLLTLFIAGFDSCEEVISYESMLLKAGKEQGIEVEGLETAARQLELLGSFSGDSVATMVMEMLDRPEQGADAYGELLAAYRAQNLKELYRIILDTDMVTDVKSAFLDERNAAWIPEMARKMKEKKVFFAVGAGHLWGPNGLISLLRGQGYTVEPVHD